MQHPRVADKVAKPASRGVPAEGQTASRRQTRGRVEGQKHVQWICSDEYQHGLRGLIGHPPILSHQCARLAFGEIARVASSQLQRSITREPLAARRFRSAARLHPIPHNLTRLLFLFGSEGRGYCTVGWRGLRSAVPITNVCQSHARTSLESMHRQIGNNVETIESLPGFEHPYYVQANLHFVFISEFIRYRRPASLPLAT
jgi:hypothetical protein